MSSKIETIQYNPEQARLWDDYVQGHPLGTYCHLSGWKEVFEKSYGHGSYFIQAVDDNRSLKGIFPLVHLRHVLFKNLLTSLPFLDLGGILAEDRQTERFLFAKALELFNSKGIRLFEIRQQREMKDSGPEKGCPSIENQGSLRCTDGPEKVRMLKELPESSKALWSELPSKLRSQVRRPLKSGCWTEIGGPELVDDFYKVFAEHMRDLGSPVHSKSLIMNTLLIFPDLARLCLVYWQEKPIAGSLIFAFKGVVSNPWSSALRGFSQMSPNMLLYWTMLEYASDHGFNRFDFGRSTPGEGTFRFKSQWGAKPQPLYWYTFTRKQTNRHIHPKASRKYSTVIKLWSMLPVAVSTMLGPRIRKYISL